MLTLVPFGPLSFLTACSLVQFFVSIITLARFVLPSIRAMTSPRRMPDR